MIYRSAPALCSSFKGVLPSDLINRYDGVGGLKRLEFDLAVVSEIHDQIKEAHADAKTDSNNTMSHKHRRAQRKTARRAAAANVVGDDGAMKLLSDNLGIKFKEDD